jgi:purine-nucleoside phosphorylase
MRLVLSNSPLRFLKMKNYKQKAIEAASFLKTRIKKPSEIGILTGTGHGEITESLDIDASFAYKNIPHFPISTVESHFGRLLTGSMHGRQIIAMQGRLHLYEGYSPADITFPIRVMQELGVKTLILFNASGGINPLFKAGDIMIIVDHLNLTGSNPLIGPNEETWGIREVRFLRAIGAEAVGFSTVHEVITAVHAGIKVLGLSTITNVHDPDKPVESTIEEIIAVAKESSLKLALIISSVIENLT